MKHVCQINKRLSLCLCITYNHSYDYFIDLIIYIILSSLLGPCSHLLGLHNLGSQIFLKDAPLALGPNFGPSVEFWVRLPLLKTQAHVAIALGTPRGTNTKTPLTMFCQLLWFYGNYVNIVYVKQANLALNPVHKRSQNSMIWCPAKSEPISTPLTRSKCPNPLE